ncbi:triphosphoribosyl-dephospho-CoA synthase MdcB [Duganella sp. BJB1802]|uniref:triphosphoribosyl-dephospho-CoA synthase MdcB n=1 Tax=Duganella sp. BJB1802 TaxID=2744575 RepID=UPI001594240E|nr:triphosphoribosyl-dephospho-CoA synthase MdcB [Duganella sp. BJB1802]
MRAIRTNVRRRLPVPMPNAEDRKARRSFAGDVARMAVGSLHAELCLYPKPGLVSPVDTGSHDDMDAQTFMRSLFSLRHYFKKICLAGWDDAPFARLKQLGIEAEAAMLKATHGINTHRGAIFSLGLLCATAGRARAQGTPMTPAALRAAMLIRWGGELAMHAAPPEENSNGLRVAALYAVSGAREEGALGLPSVFDIGVPALQAARARGARMTHARIDTLFTLMASINDSNVYHRAGPQGAQAVRAHAQRFIDLGGTANAEWHAEALASHREFVRQRLSPGGAADLLAASCLVHAFASLDRGRA